MDLIKLERINNCDVVDSRLIAMELGIKHKNFYQTIKDNQTDIEQDFGHLLFKTETVQNTAGAINEVKFAYLNEDQATYLMTLSRNTQKVKLLKRKLVKSFAQAKKIIAKQQENIQELSLKLALANAEKEKAIAEKNLLDTRHYVATALPEPVQQKVLGYKVVETEVIKERVIHNKQVIRDGSTLNKTQLCKRYGFLTKNGKPNYKQLNAKLQDLNLPSEAWELKVAFRENEEFKAEYLDWLDNFLLRDERQTYLGEY